MTQMLVRVSSAGEAATAGEAGFDVVELFCRGLDDLDAMRAVRQAFRGVFRLRVDTDDDGLLAHIASIGADEIACPVGDLDRFAAGHVRRVALLFVEDGVEPAHLADQIRDRAASVMLETRSGRRLIDGAGIAALSAFATACKAAALPFGLAGDLEAPDVARLLLLQPDLLAFDKAVRSNHDVNGALDSGALHALRALVPRTPTGHIRPSATIDKVTDRIFVRDFEIALAIGAYQAEHGKRQRVRFSVTAEVLRAPAIPRDMRDVFSYDVIIETIRVLSERAHVTFVETLAEEVAASVLGHEDVVSVEVKVEKLDVIAGAVGVEILRRRG